MTEPSPSHGYRAIVRARVRDWNRSVAPLHVFGGRPLLNAEIPRSRITGLPLQLMFDIDLSDPRLRELGITSVKRLAVLASFHSDAQPSAPLFVRHHDAGRRLEILGEPPGIRPADIPLELPQLPVDLEELSMAEAAVETADEYPEGHGPLHQVGGRPVWIVGPEQPPTCPVTGAPMRFVAAVDSDLRFPLAGGETQLLFGDGGTYYVYWSDEASISAGFVQSP